MTTLTHTRQAPHFESVGAAVSDVAAAVCRSGLPILAAGVRAI